MCDDFSVNAACRTDRFCVNDLRTMIWKSVAKRPLVVSSLTVACLCWFLGTARGDSMPSEMSDVLQANALALDPFRSEWRMKRVSSFDMAALTKHLGLMPHLRNHTRYLAEESGACFFDDGKVYARFVYQEPILKATMPPSPKGDDKKFSQVIVNTDTILTITGYAEQVTELSFDGQNFFEGDRRKDGKPDSLVVRNVKLALDQTIKIGTPERVAKYRWRHNYWHEAGYALPTNEYDYAEPRISSLVLHLAAQKNAKVECVKEKLGDRDCSKVTIAADEGRSVFYLDPGRRYCVCSREDYDKNDHLVSRTFAEDFRMQPQMENLWLPHQVRVQYFQWRDSPETPYQEVLFESHYTLVLCESMRTPDDDFALNYTEPGTLVGDSRLPTAETRGGGVVCYSVPADRADLDAAIRQAIDGTTYVPLALRNAGRRPFLLFVASNVAVLGALVFGIWWRSRKRRLQSV